MNAFSLLRLGVAGLLCVSGAQAGSLIDDGKTTLKYSQYYWKENDGGAVGPNRDEWVQALQLGFSSGWFRDVLGFDYTHALADGLRIGDDASRILPAATMGWDLGYATDAAELRYSRVHAFSPRNETGWGERLENFRGQQIDNLQIYSASYRLPLGTRLAGEYAEAQDYLRSAFIQAEQRVDLGASQSLVASLTHGRQQDAGELFEYTGVPRLYQAENSHDARYLDMTLRYNIDGHSVALSWNQVRGDDFDRLFFAQDHGTWNSSGKLYFFFGLRDEDMYKASSSLDLGKFGLPGLKMSSYYAFSNRAYGYDGFSRKEFQNVFQYSFDGPLRGLSLAWLHDRFRTTGTPDGIHRQVASRGPAGIITEHSERFYLTWQRAW